MTIRLDAIRTFGTALKLWFRQTIPLIFVVRYLSDRPIDWLFFWIGWKFLRLSATYYFNKYDADDTEDFENQIRPSKNEDGNNSYHTRFESFATARTSSKSGDSRSMLTSLPSTALSDVACYLHPRDALCLDTVLRSGMGLRNSEDVSDSNDIARCLYDDSIGRDIWKRLWYRDYGNVLLEWKVSREAFCRSLTRSSMLSNKAIDFKDGNSSKSQTDDRLEEKLSQRLDEITGGTTSMTMKYFYFLFGECYIDYVLARKNTMDECYLGLHGHIFDFTDFAEFHPGLIEPILKECGGDATYYFEDIPHSTGARNIARRLCVVVDHSVFDYCDNDNCSSSWNCGLQLVLNDDGSSKLKDLLRSSNTRPLPSTTFHANSNKCEWRTRIVPRRRKWRKHPTVARIRTSFKQAQQRHALYQSCRSSSDESKASNVATEWISSFSSLLRQHESESRIYFDPLLQEWARWSPNANT